MNLFRLCLPLLSGVALSLSAQAAVPGPVTVVDFELSLTSRDPLIEPNPVFSWLETRGMEIDAGHAHLMDTPVSSFGGTPSAFKFVASEGGTLAFSRADGGAFSLLSLDLSRLWADDAAAAAAGLPNASTIEIWGRGPGGSPRPRLVFTPGFGFETFATPSLSFIDRVTIRGFSDRAAFDLGGFALDNIVFQTVPEPQTALLLLAGLGLLAVQRRRARA